MWPSYLGYRPLGVVRDSKICFWVVETVARSSAALSFFSIIKARYHALPWQGSISRPIAPQAETIPLCSTEVLQKSLFEVIKNYKVVTL
jgi:hypothetical protein